MAVVQYVPKIVSDSSVVTPCILCTLGIFHNWVAQPIYDCMPRCQNVQWEHPPIGEALSDADLDMIGGYITRCHNSVSQYISTRPIFGIVVA